MKTARISLWTASFCFLLAAMAHVESRAQPRSSVDYDGIWNARISCPETLWNGETVRSFTQTLSGIEIKNGTTSQDVRFVTVNPPGRTLLNKVSLNLNTPQSTMSVDQRIDPWAVQPPGTPTSFNWKFDFGLSGKIENSPMSGRMLNPQSGTSRPCSVTFTSVSPAPGSLAARRPHQPSR